MLPPRSVIGVIISIIVVDVAGATRPCKVRHVLHSCLERVHIRLSLLCCLRPMPWHCLLKEKISRAPKLNAKFIADTRAERVRAGREGHSFTVIDIGEKKVCQLRARAARKENGERNQDRAQITCDTCRVHLCLYCWMDWHSDRLT